MEVVGCFCECGYPLMVSRQGDRLEVVALVDTDGVAYWWLPVTSCPACHNEWRDWMLAALFTAPVGL